MNRRQKIIVSITGIFIILLALVGLTYAYFLTRITGNENEKSINVTTANLQLLYEDDTNEVVTVEKLMPSDTVYTKSFTVKNEGNANIDYGVYLINVVNTFERKDDIKYTMECTTNGTLPCGAVATETTFPSGISELSTATIEPQKTHSYTFKFTYKDSGTDQSVDMNKKLEAKIQIFGESGDGTILPYEEGTLAYNIINNAINKKNGTLLVDTPPSKVAEEISSNNWEFGTEEKVYFSGAYSLVKGYAETEDALIRCYQGYPGEDFSEWYYDCSGVKEYTSCTNDVKGKIAYINPDLPEMIYVEDCEDGKIVIGKAKYEKVLSTTEDDYGTSYYYRGNIQDNYVTFANMCWRIVRIAGDGSTKLILEDQDEPCSETMNGNWDISVSNSEDADNTGNFGYSINSNGQSLIINYLNGDSYSMASAFKNFQTTKLSNYLSDLKEGEWCFADNAYASESADITTATPLTEIEKLAIQAEQGLYYYDSYVRLIGNSTKHPTLKCNGKKIDKYKDNAIMYVGTLTADEIVYAGADVNDTPNHNYYLMNEYSLNNLFWTLSPAYFEGSEDKVFIYADGFLNGYGYVSSSYYLRPSVSLKSSTLINAGGEGTLAKPYVVNKQAN